MKPGDPVGRFVVDAMIGEGGLAQVYRVKHAELGGLHALKMLSWQRQGLAERLLLEGRIQAQLRHPNLVAVTDVVRHQGRIGLLMEYVDGRTLLHWLHERNEFDLDDAMVLFASIVAGVAAAHDAGILHRDLKPANILLASVPGGVVPKVTDFGIAKVVAEELLTTGGTKAGATMGTPGYMAPEQVEDAGTVDARADVFALGVIGYEILSGHSPFADEEGNYTIRCTALVEPPPLAEQSPDCPPRLAAAIMRALSKDAQHRHATARAFGNEAFAAHPDLLARLAPTSPPSLSLSPGAPPRPETSVTLTPAPMLRHSLPTEDFTIPPPKRTPWALIGAGLMLLGALGLWASLGAGGSEAPPVEVIGEISVEAPSAPVPAAPKPASIPDQPVTPISPPAGDPPAPVPSTPDLPPTPTTEPPPAPEQPPEPEPTAELPAEDPPQTTPPLPVDGPPPAENPPSDPDDGVALVEPRPAPTPEPAPTFDFLVGTWTGTAGGRPFELRLTEVVGERVSGRAIFILGPSQRIVDLTGTIRGGQLALDAKDGSLLFRGQATERQLTGEYSQRGSKRTLSWSATR